jgi:hypothetical protein
VNEGGREGERGGGGRAVMLAMRKLMPLSSSEVPAHVSACCCSGAVYRFSSFTAAARYRRTDRRAAVYRFASFASTARLRRGFTSFTSAAVLRRCWQIVASDLALLALLGRLWQATWLSCQGAALSKNAT